MKKNDLWRRVKTGKRERTPGHGMGAIPKQPYPNPPAYATDTHRKLSASASSALPLAAQVDEPDPVKEPNKWVQWHASQMWRDPRLWPKMVFALPGRDQPTASGQTHSGIFWGCQGYSSLGKGMPSGLIPLVSNVSTAFATCPL